LSKVARCISIWSLVETLTANVALYAVKGDMRVAMEMYLSITSSSAANAALKAAVRLGLEPKYGELFNALWTISGELASERHKLAHWGMGYSKDIPNAILLLNPKDGIRRGAHNISVGRLEQYAKFKPRPINKVRVCSSEFLDHLIQLFESHLDRVHGFTELLSLHEATQPPSRRTLKMHYDRLYNEPEIHQKIVVMRGQQNAKASPKRRALPKTSRRKPSTQ
jgi:hypothetical protein